MDNNTRFSVYKHRLVIKENLLVTRQFIVLKHADGTLEFTNFHRFIRSPVHRVRKYTDDGNSRFYFIAQFLNYVFFQCGLVKLDDITVEMVAEFLNAYGMCSLPGDHDQTRRSEKTVERCVRNVMDFLELYIAERKDKCLIKSDDLYRYVSKRDKHGKLIRVRVPVFDVYYSGSTKKIYRDIPNKAFDMIFSHIMRSQTVAAAGSARMPSGRNCGTFMTTIRSCGQECWSCRPCRERCPRNSTARSAFPTSMRHSEKKMPCAKKRHKKGKGDENHQQSKI